MRLAHLHLPQPISYNHSLRLQEALLSRHFAVRDAIRNNKPISSHVPPATLLTFSTHPTYTVGRRHLNNNPISGSQISFLTANNHAEFHASPRGGLLTYHGPGQLTGYAVVDLRKHGITPRCYIRLLERSVMRTCAAVGVPNTTTTADPGVWISDSDRKVCALGVHVTRGCTSHGIGLNVEDQRGELKWGFDRIVACGLEGKSVTWLAREGAKDGLTTGAVAGVLAGEFAKCLSEMGKLDIQGVDSVSEEEVLVGEG